MSEREALYEFLRPGSEEALAAGCKCPVIDNGRGRGYRQLPDGEVMWVFTFGCPVHPFPGGDEGG